jgi:phosphatidylglycerophosphate synthase
MLELIGVIALMFFILALIRTIMAHRLRNRILAKEASPDMTARILEPESARARALGALKWALVLIGVGLGVAFGQLVPSHSSDNMTMAGIFVFAGLGYFIYYLIAMRAAKSE